MKLLFFIEKRRGATERNNRKNPPEIPEDLYYKYSDSR